MNKEKIINILKNISAVIVIIAMFVIIFYQNRDRDILKFGQNESNKIVSSVSEGSESFSAGDVGRIGDKVAFLTTTSYSVLDENGEGKSVNIALSEPQLHTEGEFAACYNLGSEEVTVYKNTDKIYSVETDNKIIGVKVNKNGYLFVATEKEGYNCECKVYNRSGEAIFKWDISKSEFIDGDINCSNNAMALSLAAAGNEKLLGEVILIDITDAKVIKKETFDDRVFYSVDFNSNDTYTAVGSHSLSYFNCDGTEKWSYNYGKKTLLKADVSSHDMMVLAFSDTNALIEGNSTDVKVINRLGKVTAESVFEGVADGISHANDTVALVFGKKVCITNSSLRKKKTVENDYSVKKVALYDDDKHLFVLGTSGGEIIE